MIVQFCAVVIGFGVWFCLMAHNIQPSEDKVVPDSLPAGSEEYLPFIVFRLIPAALVLYTLITCEWLLYRLYFSEKD
jgi:hypothetical protein